MAAELDPTPGAANTIADVPGIRVGHCTRVGEGWCSGTTVVLPPPAGAVGGVDVRGGGPGTRETDLLDPRNLVERVHAVVLTGGSAFGLAAADGVMTRLADAGVGFPVPLPGAAAPAVVPIVPAAVLFDLGRGGTLAARPGPAEGAAAYDAASTVVAQGSVGAGTGAVAGGLKGGVGSASAVLGGWTVGALVVVNCVGSAVDPDSGELLAARFGLGEELAGLARPSAGQAAALRAVASRRGQAPSGLGQATTIGVLATDLTLTKAQCAKVAGIGHDGLARAIRPVHTMADGDTLFALATGQRPAPDLAQLHQMLEAAADCVTRAVAHAMLTAEPARTPAGDWPAYRSFLDGPPP